MIESVKVGDVVLAQISSKGDVWPAIVLEIPDREVYIVDRLQKGILLEFVKVPGTPGSRSDWSTTRYWSREEDLQAI